MVNVVMRFWCFTSQNLIKGPEQALNTVGYSYLFYRLFVRDRTPIGLHCRPLF